MTPAAIAATNFFHDFSFTGTSALSHVRLNGPVSSVNASTYFDLLSRVPSAAKEIKESGAVGYEVNPSTRSDLFGFGGPKEDFEAGVVVRYAPQGAEGHKTWEYEKIGEVPGVLGKKYALRVHQPYEYVDPTKVLRRLARLSTEAGREVSIVGFEGKGGRVLNISHATDHFDLIGEDLKCFLAQNGIQPDDNAAVNRFFLAAFIEHIGSPGLISSVQIGTNLNESSIAQNKLMTVGTKDSGHKDLKFEDMDLISLIGNAATFSIRFGFVAESGGMASARIRRIKDQKGQDAIGVSITQQNNKGNTEIVNWNPAFAGAINFIVQRYGDE